MKLIRLVALMLLIAHSSFGAELLPPDGMTLEQFEFSLRVEMEEPLHVLMPPGIVLFDDVCYDLDNPGGCAGRMDVVLSSSPAPTEGSRNLSYWIWEEGFGWDGYETIGMTRGPITIVLDVIPTSGPAAACTIVLDQGATFLGTFLTVEANPETGLLDASQEDSVYDVLLGPGPTDCDPSLTLAEGVLMQAVVAAMTEVFMGVTADYIWGLDADGRTRFETAVETVTAPEYVASEPPSMVPGLRASASMILIGIMGLSGCRRLNS